LSPLWAEALVTLPTQAGSTATSRLRKAVTSHRTPYGDSSAGFRRFSGDFRRFRLFFVLSVWAEHSSALRPIFLPTIFFPLLLVPFFCQVFFCQFCSRQFRAPAHRSCRRHATGGTSFESIALFSASTPPARVFGTAGLGRCQERCRPPSTIADNDRPISQSALSPSPML